MPVRLNEVLELLQGESNLHYAKSMSRFAIPAENALGIKLPVLRKLAREIGNDQKLAEDLWQHHYHESKLLATLIADPRQFKLKDADRWVKSVYSWDLCDQLCINILVKTDFAWKLPARWAPWEPEFERRAGIVMIAVLAVHHKKVLDEEFLQFVPLLKSYATDPRNFVKKAVNWAIRQMGKRRAFLHSHMICLCHQLLDLDSRSASSVARDALRELESDKLKMRLGI